MIEKIAESVQGLDTLNRLLATPGREVVRGRDVVYFFNEGGKTYARLEDDRVVETSDDLGAQAARFHKYFLRCQRFYLVRLDKIKGISRRYQEWLADFPEMDFSRCLKGSAMEAHRSFYSTMRSADRARERSRDYEFNLYGTERRVPITKTYHAAVKRALDIRHLSHLTPEDKWLKKLRLLQLKDFGMREFHAAKPVTPAQVEAFKEKWDIKRFSREKMLVHFRRVGAAEIDRVMVIRNILWQFYRWIGWGIEPEVDGNIRSLWYRVKAVLAYHSDILQASDVELFYSTLSSMVENDRLFRYKDFGFMDMNEPYRGVGAKRPEVVLASEKLGHYRFIMRLAGEIGASFICLRGEPSHLSLEYFADDLRAACGRKKIEVYVISDIDPAGFSIESNLVKRLEFNGLKMGRRVTLVDVSMFSDKEIEIFRFPVIRYRREGSSLVALPPSTHGQLTKAMEWFFGSINDQRLFGQMMIDGQETFIIYGIESDAADQLAVRDRFLKAVAR